MRSEKSIYGTNKVGSEIIGGVNLMVCYIKRLDSVDLVLTERLVMLMLLQVGLIMLQLQIIQQVCKFKGAFVLDGAVSEAECKINSNLTQIFWLILTLQLAVVVVDIEEEELSTKCSEGDPDLDNLSAFGLSMQQQCKAMQMVLVLRQHKFVV